jgi:hypothetical protein
MSAGRTPLLYVIRDNPASIWWMDLAENNTLSRIVTPLIWQCYCFIRSAAAAYVVLATVPDRHFGSGSGSKLNRCQIGGPGCQHTRTVNSGTVRCKSPNPSGLGGLSVVLATVPNWRFGSGSGLEPNWNRCNGFHPIKKPNRTEPAVFWPVPPCRKLRTLAPIKYLSCDRITIWYIRKRCSFRCSFTSCSPIGDPITIRGVASKKVYFWALFHCNSTNSD